MHAGNLAFVQVNGRFQVAQAFWQRAGSDERISEGFSAVCLGNAEAMNALLAGWPEVGAIRKRRQPLASRSECHAGHAARATRRCGLGTPCRKPSAGTC